MPNWLSAAKRAFQNQPPKEPERFEIRCACDTPVTGTRTHKPQQLPCPKCSRVLLVFPESLYPLPKAPKPKPPKNQNRADPEKGKQSPSGANRSSSAPTVRPSESQQAANASRSNAGDSKEIAPKSESVAQKPALKPDDRASDPLKIASRRPLFTPLRMVVLLMCLILGLTGYWMVRRQAREQALGTVADAVRIGRKAVEEDDLLTAGSEFRRAVAALDVLGQTDGSARSIRQTAGELSAINGLSDKTLRDLLIDAVESAKSGDAASWADTFRINYHDTWVVFDSIVTPLPTEDTKLPSEFLIDLPISSGEHRLMLHLRTRSLEKVERDGNPRRMVLAARLENCMRDTERPNTWHVELDGKSALLWTDAKLVERLGWPRDAALEKLLAEQRQQAGVESQGGAE